MQSLDDLLTSDLNAISTNLRDEFASISGKSLLITGGGGFLGYYLVQSVLHWNQDQGASDKIRVTVYDNYARGAPKWLDDLRGTDALTVLNHDITTPLPDDMDDFASIVHAAGIASPITYRKYPIRTMDANVNGLRVLLDYAVERKNRGNPIDNLLFFSSSEIYGDPTPDQIPTSEDYRGNVSCTGPRACYDESKRYGETLCVSFAKVHDVPVKIVRPFNNYGPGLQLADGRVIPDMAKNILEGSDIVLLSDGSARRTFCYAADSIAGYYKVLVNGHDGEPYNVGVETPEISMYELAQRMQDHGRQLFGYEGSIIRETSQDPEYLTDNPARRCPVIAKAREHTGYDPSVSIDEGLERSLVWYFHNRGGESG